MTAAPAALALVLSACASAPIQPPTLQVAGLQVGDMGLTGVALDVRFRVRNAEDRDRRSRRRHRGGELRHDPGREGHAYCHGRILCSLYLVEGLR